MIRIRLSTEGKEKLARERVRLENQPLISAKRGILVSVKRVAEIVRINESIVRNFFINTPDHRKYDFQDEPVHVILKRTSDKIFFEEEKLLIWLDLNYVGMKELYWARKQQFRAPRVRI